MKIVLILIFSFLLRVSVAFNHAQQPGFKWQQDNYLGYATGIFSDIDSRLFPGYPLILKIFGAQLLTGVCLNILLAVITIFLFYKITKNYKLTFIFSLFPPIWVTQSTKISNEPLITYLILLAVYFLMKRSFFVSGFVTGLSISVRLIAVSFAAAAFTTTKSKKYLAGFIFGSLALPVYNFFVFGPTNIFWQIFKNPSIGGTGGTNIGLFQIILDIPRSLNWGQYNIFASGMFYLAISFFALTNLFIHRKKSQLYTLSFNILLFGLLFIFSLWPIPLLEEYSRFLVPLTPAIIIAMYIEGKNKVTFDKKTGFLATNPPPPTPDGKDLIGRDFENIDYSRSRYLSHLLLAKLGLKSGKLLDIGCGSGFLVETAGQHGFDAIGIDSYKPAIAFATKNLKIKAFATTLDKFRPKGKFDVIVLNHVIEHISDPISFLEKIKTLLNKNGTLLIACPNYHSLMRFIFNDRWYGFRSEMHVWQMTQKPLLELLKKSGFKSIKNFPASLDYNPANQIKRVIFKIITKVSETLNLGDQIIMTAQI